MDLAKFSMNSYETLPYHLVKVFLSSLRFHKEQRGFRTVPIFGPSCSTRNHLFARGNDTECKLSNLGLLLHVECLPVVDHKPKFQVTELSHLRKKKGHFPLEENIKLTKTSLLPNCLQLVETQWYVIWTVSLRFKTKSLTFFSNNFPCTDVKI